MYNTDSESTIERATDTTTRSERHVNLQVRKFNILHEIMLLLVPKKDLYSVYGENEIISTAV